MSAAAETGFDFEAAGKLPELIRFGTSSWTYPGWQGIVYHNNYKDEKELKAKSLEEYGRFPWFRAVGIDSSFYRPTSRKTLLKYAEQLPEHIRWVSKVWEEITIPTYAKHARYGKNAGKDNPHFLNAQIFCDKVLAEHDRPEFVPHAGPFVFQFQSMRQELTTESGSFIPRLDEFLAKLPKGFQYAVEIRNRELLRGDYFAVLNKHGATHCFNHWSYMPPLREQMQAAADAGGLTAPFHVARVLTPLGLNYEKAVDKFKPYNQIKAPLPEMRADVVKLAKRALQKKVMTFILLNNRSEGCAPMTIDAIGRTIVKNEVG